MSNYFLQPKKSHIALATFVKNEENCIEHMFKSVINYVDELIVVDTGSTDRTMEICRDYNARIYQVGFSDFGSIRTLTAHLAKTLWVLMLDADETISHPELLSHCIGRSNVEAIALPRKRWLDLDMTKQTEIEAYPDWQVRLIQNKTDFIYRRALHEEFHGGAVTHIDNGPIINHFQDVFKGKEQNAIRYKLYKQLAVKAKVALHGGKVLEDE